MLSTVTSRIYEFEEFRLVPDEGLLLHKGTPIDLNPKAFAVLAMLVEHHGHLVSKSEILDAIWEGAFIEEGAISKAVWFVRNALGDNSKERFIKTIPKRGYRFVAPVSVIDGSGAFRLSNLREAEDNHEELVSRAPAVTGDETNGSTKPAVSEEAAAARVVSKEPAFFVSLRGWAAYAGIAAVLLGGVAIYLILSGKNISGKDDGGRIAVLPFRPVNAETRDPIYELGVADSLIVKIGTSPKLAVRQLNAVRNYLGLERDPIEIGKEQSVDYVLSSHYQLANGRIKVTSQLFNVANGQVEDTITVEKEAANSFTAQDAIANDIGNRLLARFGSDASDFRAKRGTDSQEAYRLYMMGMNLSEERGVQNVQKALEYLQRAVDLDPNYALAWAGVAHLHRDMVGHSDPDAKGHYAKSMEAIRKALSIDPNTSDAYSALCHNKNRYEYDTVGAEAACKRALELDPNSPQAHKTYANFLYSRGRFDEAIAEIRTAMDLQPVSYKNQQTYGLALLYARRFAEAEAQFKRLLELNPNHYFIHGHLVTILEAQGKESEAFEYLIKSLIGKKADNRTIERFKTAYARSGWRGVTIEQINAAGETGSFHLAGLYAKIGDKDKAFEYLEKAYRERSFLIAVLQVAPQLDPIRDDPRYAALVRQIEGK